jgi:competence protein ComEC
MSFLHSLQKTPFARFLIPLIIGIGWETCGFIKLYPILFAFAFSLLLVGFFSKKQPRIFHYRWTFGLSVSLFFFALGIFLSSCKREALNITFNDNSERLFLAEIVENPRERSSSIECLVTLSLLNKDETNVEDSFKPVKAILYIRKDSSSAKLRYGNTLLISHNFSSQTKTLNPEEFDYEEYLHKKGISTSIYISPDKWRLFFSEEKFSLYNESKQMQLKLMSIYKAYGIKGEEFAVLSALTLGNKEYIDADLRSSYTVTGAAHILAVSGLHVGVVCFVFKFILGFLFKSNRFLGVKMVILILALWGYAFITGLSPSVVRATIMFSFVSVGMMLQRKSLIYNTLSASAFCMLLYNPFYLFDISFQFSYIAVLFIVFFQSRIYRLIRFRNWLADKTWDLFSVSVAAQLGTFPFALYYFHQFPNYFWLSGFVVIPLAGVIIYLAMALFALSGIPVLATGIAFVLNWVLKFQNFSIRLMEELPYAQFRDICFGHYDLFFVYAGLLLLAFYLFSGRYRHAVLFLSCFLIYFSIDTIDSYQKINRKTFAVYNTPGVSAINKIENGKNYLYYQGDLQDIHKKISNFWIKSRVPPPERIAEPYFLIGTKKVFVLTDDSYKKCQTNSPLPVDFLVLSNNAPYTVSELCGLFHFQLLIADSSNSNHQLKKWKEQCSKMNVTCHIVKEQGAYLINF